MNTKDHGLFRCEDGKFVPASLDEIVATAKAGLEAQVIGGDYISSPTAARDYITLKLAQLEHEVFCVAFLDSQHRVIEFQEMFRGTLAQASVYPREVVKEALRLNAGSVLLVHNHPSGDFTQSRSDEMLTQTLKSSLQLVDVRVLDHLIVSKAGYLSFAERGLL